MAGERGASAGEAGEMDEREDGRDGRGCGAGRSTAGRMMPASGVDVEEARLELGWAPVRMELVARGEVRPEWAVCGVEMGWSSGMSSNSCLGLRRMSRGELMYEAEAASRGCGAPASVSASAFAFGSGVACGIVGSLFRVIIAFSLGRPDSFASDGWAAMSDSPSAVARVDACARRSGCAWTDWAGCAWECDGTGSRDCDSAACSIPVDSCGASVVSFRGLAVESMIHSRGRLAKQLRSLGAMV